MRLQLFILVLVVSLFTVGCAHDKTKDSSDSSNLSGGGAAHIDSLKTIGTGVNGSSSNTLDAKDTLIDGHSVASPTDSAKKKKP